MTGKDKYLLGGSKEDRTRLFSVVPSERARCKGHKLKYRKYPLNVTESFFFFSLRGWSNTETGCPETL